MSLLAWAHSQTLAMVVLIVKQHHSDILLRLLAFVILLPVSWLASRSLHGTRYHGITVTIRHIRIGVSLFVCFWSFISMDVCNWLYQHPAKVTLSIVCLDSVGLKRLFLQSTYDISFLYFINIFLVNLFDQYQSSYTEDLIFGDLDTSWFRLCIKSSRYIHRCLDSIDTSFNWRHCGFV